MCNKNWLVIEISIYSHFNSGTRKFPWKSLKETSVSFEYSQRKKLKICRIDQSGSSSIKERRKIFFDDWSAPWQSLRSNVWRKHGIARSVVAGKRVVHIRFPGHGSAVAAVHRCAAVCAHTTIASYYFCYACMPVGTPTTDQEYWFPTIEGRQYGRLPAPTGNDCSTPANPISPFPEPRCPVTSPRNSKTRHPRGSVWETLWYSWNLDRNGARIPTSFDLSHAPLLGNFEQVTVQFSNQFPVFIKTVWGHSRRKLR